MEVREIRTKSELKEFFNFDYGSLPQDFPELTPIPTLSRLLLGKFPDPKKLLLIAKDEKGIIARAGFQANSRQTKPTVHFGFFEARPDASDAVKAIFKKARDAYHDHKFAGPYNFRMEDPYTGVLVEGNQNRPTFLMSSNPNYYNELLTESAGLSPAMDLVNYRIESDRPIPDMMKKKCQKTRDKGYSIRWIDPKQLRKETAKIIGIFNEALKDNWGYERISNQQEKEMYWFLKYIINPEFVSFTMKDGKEVGCLVMLPNYNELIERKKYAVPKILWAAMRKSYHRFHSLRGYALGVLSAHQGQGIGNLLFEATWQKCHDFTLSGRQKIDYCEISWVLGNNIAMNGLMEYLDIKYDKKYRVYESEF